MQEVESRTEHLRRGMMAVGAAGTAAFAALGTAMLGFIRAGAGFEQTQIAFETMVGSAETANRLLQDLAEFGARTPFELDQLEEASKRLLAYGIEAGDLIPTLTTLGDITAGVGMDKLPQLILAFGQVKAATRLTGMELRQFTEAGVPLLDALAAHFGVTAGRVQEMVSEGKVGFQDVQIALQNLTAEGGKFNNLMARQSRSLGGLWSNFKDQVSLTARSIGEELLPYLKPLVEQLIKVVQVVGEFVKEHPKLSTALIVAATLFAGLMAILLPIALILPTLAAGFSILGTVFGVLASGPGLLIIGLLSAITFAVIQVIRIILLLKNEWHLVLDGMRIIAAESANAIISVFENMINWIIGKINSLITKVNNLLAKLRDLPMIGSKFDDFAIPTLSNVDLGRFNTESGLVDKVGVGAAAPAQNVVVTGNTFLSEDAAEEMGDLILSKLKLSNPI